MYESEPYLDWHKILVNIEIRDWRHFYAKNHNFFGWARTPFLITELKLAGIFAAKIVDSFQLARGEVLDQFGKDFLVLKLDLSRQLWMLRRHKTSLMTSASGRKIFGILPLTLSVSCHTYHSRFTGLNITKFVLAKVKLENCLIQNLTQFN